MYKNVPHPQRVCDKTKWTSAGVSVKKENIANEIVSMRKKIASCYNYKWVLRIYVLCRHQVPLAISIRLYIYILFHRCVCHFTDYRRPIAPRLLVPPPSRQVSFTLIPGLSHFNHPKCNPLSLCSVLCVCVCRERERESSADQTLAFIFIYTLYTHTHSWPLENKSAKSNWCALHCGNSETIESFFFLF